ncbi:DNRLRE domain-containing protein [Dinghuibacter silviterrae]|uniref:Carbohydrate-binding module family 96 domain-containing protein n=1 Tax=Dinghuibacter silviterrae TaxID=1539049 RepID=A0A4R8DSA3_9BACT|nr:DNRLRE domain-containing protein [Dinghuibacter silviterrae]TDX00257.1 hypothetical protein EDB95_1276 [Dinghuibacter silviterrae]
MKKLITCATLCSALMFVNCKKTTIPLPPTITIIPTPAVQLPADTASLNAIVTAKGGNTIAQETWSQLSGPNTATMANASSASTPISDLIAGTYVFKLQVTSSDGLSVSAEDTIVVKSSTVYTLTLKPTDNPNEVDLWGTPQNTDFGTNPLSPEFDAEYWTVHGNPAIIRSLVSFDLSSIPTTASILTATLSLYSDTTPLNGNLIDANYGAGDSIVIRQVTSPWVATTVTWPTQPSVTDTNQVLLPATALPFLNLPSINVTGIVSNQVSTGTNYGFQLALQNEAGPYISRIFCSSRYSDSTRHPSLTITYSIK